MARFATILALISIVFTSFIVQAKQSLITKNLIEEKNQEMANLLGERDAKKTINFLHSHISENATFQISFQNTSLPLEHQKQTMVMDKKAYINSFIQGLHYVDNYDVKIETKRIEILPETNSAIVEEVMVEEGVMLNPSNPQDKGMPFSSKTTCKTLYGLNDTLIQSDRAQCHTETSEINTI